jgi:type IV pilus assembly protein PilN
MIRINLLPFRSARKKENVRKQVNIYGLTILLLLLCMVYFFISFNGRIANLSGREAALAAELAKYADTNRLLKEISDKIDALRNKLDVIRTLEQQKTGPVLLLEEIARAVPKDRLWLRTLTEKDGILMVEGSAMDNDTVAMFMTALEKADHITSVDLVNTRMKHLGQYRLNVTEFILECKTYSFKEPEPQDEQKGSKPQRARR